MSCWARLCECASARRLSPSVSPSLSRPTTSHYIISSRFGRYEFQRLHQYRPYPLKAVRDICRQTLEALHFMHSLELVHTDIKPENICLVNGEPDRTGCVRMCLHAPFHPFSIPLIYIVVSHPCVHLAIPEALEAACPRTPPCVSSTLVLPSFAQGTSSATLWWARDNIVRPKWYSGADGTIPWTFGPWGASSPKCCAGGSSFRRYDVHCGVSLSLHSFR